MAISSRGYDSETRWEKTKFTVAEGSPPRAGGGGHSHTRRSVRIGIYIDGPDRERESKRKRYGDRVLLGANKTKVGHVLSRSFGLSRIPLDAHRTESACLRTGASSRSIQIRREWRSPFEIHRNPKGGTESIQAPLKSEGCRRVS